MLMKLTLGVNTEHSKSKLGYLRNNNYFLTFIYSFLSNTARLYANYWAWGFEKNSTLLTIFY